MYGPDQYQLYIVHRLLVYSHQSQLNSHGIWNEFLKCAKFGNISIVIVTLQLSRLSTFRTKVHFVKLDTLGMTILLFHFRLQLSVSECLFLTEKCDNKKTSSIKPNDINYLLNFSS